jgi:Dockerin type I domain
VGQPLYDRAYDLNGDGVINSIDYMLWTRLLGDVV